MNSLPDIGKVGNVALRRVPEGKAPEYYLWKKALEREWAGEWGTLAKLTSYRFKTGLDPSFVEERPEFKKGQLHHYEWLLMENGGIIYLYDEKEMLFSLLTTKQTAEKVLENIKEARISLTQDDRLSHEIRFPGSRLLEACELAGARRARRMSEEQKAQMRERALKSGFGSDKKVPASECQGKQEGQQPNVRGSQKIAQG